MQKRCNRCGELKAFDCFSGSQSNKDGRSTQCKPCVSLRNKEYWRTPTGRLAQMFAAQTQASIQRGHSAPQYTKDELASWAYQQGFAALMAQWAAADFKKELIPSIDRIDPNHGYSLDNIRMVTWAENNDKAYEDRKACKHVTKQNRRVEQLSLKGEHIAYYDSIALAARTTGAVRTNINAMCAGKPALKSVGGFIWRYG